MVKYSVIISTYNRCKTLALTLDSVAGQTIPAKQYEIIVVDDGSTDNTKEVVSEFQKNHRNIKYFYQQNSGPAKARNLGIKESTGEIIFFTDDDCIVPKNWMETLLDGFKRYPDVVGVGGWYRPANKSLADKYFQRYLDFSDLKRNPEMFNTEIATNMFGYNLAGNTANMCYKKSVLEEVGGFDENLYFPGAVDWELKRNIQGRGYHLLYLPFSVGHLKNFGVKTFIKKFFNQGQGRYYMLLKHRDLAGNPRYDISFKVMLSGLVGEYNFFAARFLELTSMFCGRAYTKHFKTFKNVLLPSNTGTKKLLIIKRSISDNRALITNISLFERTNLDNLNKEKIGGFYSIIIPTYNRCQALILTLDSVAKQTIPVDQYEILVIDDGSTDNTESRIRNYESGIKNPKIRYFKIEHGGPAKARNKGIKESTGEIIFFTDDDCIVPKNWMETLLDGFKRYPDVVGVGGWLQTPTEMLRKNFIERFIYFLHFHIGYFPARILTKCEILSNDPERGLDNFAGNTANLSVKKNILEQIGGFREDYYWPGSEDSDLSFRILNAGLKLLYLPFHVQHIKDIDLMGFLKLFFKRGANFYLFLKFNRKALDKINAGDPNNYDTFPILIKRLIYRPQKFLTFMQFASHKAGMIYMKNKLGE